MKNTIHTLLLFGVLVQTSSLVFAEDNSDLTEGPQTLLPPSETTPQVEEIEAKKTEVIPAMETSKEENLDETTVNALPNESEKLIPKNSVVSEEELLLPKKKTPENKVKTKQVSETEMYIQEADKFKLSETFKNLQLNDVIEQGLRKNDDQIIRNQQSSLNEVYVERNKDAFWMPNFKLNLTTSSQRISTLSTSNRQSTLTTPMTPSGTFGIVMEDYTVFNWGKDYALYLNKKTTLERNKQIFDETKREFKLDLIKSYFDLMISKNVSKIRQDQLRQASFIYRLNKEKITIGKTSKQEYYLARSEYLKAQNDFHEAKLEADRSDESMAYLISDNIGTKYILNEILDYKRVKLTLEDSLQFSQKSNPTILTSKTYLENAEREYDVALKENLPLPKFTVNLGAYNKRFGPTINQTGYIANNGSGNIELVAAINASWAITGEDGLFNSNKLAVGRLGKEIALKELDKNKHFTQTFIRQTYNNILSLQNQILILEARLPSLQKAFDTILDNYLSGKAKFYDFHLALNELSETKILFEHTKLNHLKEKLVLAKLIGLEDFPGENFEQLAKRIKGK